MGERVYLRNPPTSAAPSSAGKDPVPLNYAPAEGSLRILGRFTAIAWRMLMSALLRFDELIHGAVERMGGGWQIGFAAGLGLVLGGLACGLFPETGAAFYTAMAVC